MLFYAPYLGDAGRQPSGDPAGTAPVRRRYTTLLNIRWRQFNAALRSAIVDQDLLGLRPDKVTTLSFALAAMTKDGRAKAFQIWVDNSLSRIVLENETAYLDPMITVAYNRAVVRAQKRSLAVQPPGATNNIWGLQQLVYMEMQGICEALSQRLVRLATLALIDERKPQVLLEEMKLAVQQIGVVRSRTMVESYVAKAHSTASLDTYEAAGVARVGLVPELIRVPKVGLRDATRKKGPGSRSSRSRPPSSRTVSRLRAAAREQERRFRAEAVEVETAGDDLVCPRCEEIAADGPYSINQARQLIPAHPNCRCDFVPESEAEFP